VTKESINSSEKVNSMKGNTTHDRLKKAQKNSEEKQ
jgi:hypothetical protein